MYILIAPPAMSPGRSAEGDLKTIILSMAELGIKSKENDFTSTSVDGVMTSFNSTVLYLSLSPLTTMNLVVCSALIWP